MDEKQQMSSTKELALSKICAFHVDLLAMLRVWFTRRVDDARIATQADIASRVGVSDCRDRDRARERATLSLSSTRRSARVASQFRADAAPSVHSSFR